MYGRKGKQRWKRAKAVKRASKPVMKMKKCAYRLSLQLRCEQRCTCTESESDDVTLMTGESNRTHDTIINIL